MARPVVFTKKKEKTRGVNYPRNRLHVPCGGSALPTHQNYRQKDNREKLEKTTKWTT